MLPQESYNVFLHEKPGGFWKEKVFNSSEALCKIVYEISSSFIKSEVENETISNYRNTKTFIKVKNKIKSWKKSILLGENTKIQAFMKLQ